jgi:DNA-binding NtrC family response regulator
MAGEPRTLHLRQLRLTVVRGGQRGREFVIAADAVRVGKAEDNDIILSEDTVSRAHFEILRDGKGYLLRDLRSTNGTFLDGAEIREAYIRAGSLIAAGAAQLRFDPLEEVIPIVPAEGDAHGDLVGRSLRMREAYTLITRLAPTELAVLVEGEAGTGKRLVARALHQGSRRAAGPLVLAPCEGEPGEVERALFGHERGAVPGGGPPRAGHLEQAAGGTLVLLEPGELSGDVQGKLQRVLETRELRRLGGTRTLRLDARVIAVSRRDLPRDAARGRLREGLLARLAAATIPLPPLRERPEDIPLLVRHLLARRAAAGGGPPLPADLPEDGFTGLAAFTWPGNVAELEEVVDRLPPSALVVGARILGDGDGPLAIDERPFDPGLPFREQKERWSAEFERRYLTWLLARAAGNISRAAREADMDRKYLHKLLRRHGLVGPS